MISQKKKTKKIVKKEEIVLPEIKTVGRGRHLVENIFLPQRVVSQIADEVAKVLSKQLKRTPRKKGTPKSVIDYPLFLDTSAIIDARVFELIRIGVFNGTFVVIEGVLDELKHIADSKDDSKKERGRKGMKLLEQLKKQKGEKFEIVDDENPKNPVDERIISTAKKHKGKIITCDFNLAKKAQIGGVTTIDMYEVANVLKTTALPGEIFFVKVIQKGKGDRQGVGYLPDGTMIVIEEGENPINQTVRILVSRVIQTDVGRIFFGKIVV